MKNSDSRHPIKRRPSKKQADYAAGVLSGKTKKQAAVDAGYSESTARNAAQNIENSPKIKELFEQALTSNGITLDKLAQRLAEALDAVKVLQQTKYSRRERVVDYGERRAAVELCLKVKGLFAPQKFECHHTTLEELLTNSYGEDQK